MSSVNLPYGGFTEHLKIKMHPFLGNTAKTIQYILIWLGFALLQTYVLTWLLVLPFWMIFIYSCTLAIVFGGIGMLLWTVMKYGNFSALTVFQRLINQIALAFISIGIWLAFSYGIFLLIFGSNTAQSLISIQPVTAMIGLLIYLLIMQNFSAKVLSNSEVEKNETLNASEEETNLLKVPESDWLERIAVKSGTKIHVVLIDEIFYLQADGDYVQIYTSGGKYLKEQTMKFFEEHLPENKFVRVHRSVIVNVEMISRIELYEKQNQLLTLKNGQQIKTSPAGYKTLKARLKL